MSKILFLPQDYSAPKAAGNYMKLQAGENRIRILSAPIYGWLDFGADGKPIRSKYAEKPKAPFNAAKPIKHFWAMIVWNYNEERVQIYEVTQATIQTPLSNYAKDPDWGNPCGYDIKITKSGEGMKTEYVVTPARPKALDESIKLAFYEKPICLDALFDGFDPFADSGKPTAGMFEEDETAPSDHTHLLEAMKDCSQAFKDSIKKFLKDNKLKADFSDLPDNLVERVEKGIQKDLAASHALQEAL